MVITFTDPQIRLVLESLKQYAEQYRRTANDPEAGYSSETRQVQLGKAVSAHDLVENISSEIEAEALRSEHRAKQAKSLDPYDVYWPANDPRNW